jgi:hypothetical protein
VPCAAATSMTGVKAVLNRVQARVREDYGSQVVIEDRTSTAGIKTVVSGVRLVFGVWKVALVKDGVNESILEGLLY